MVRVNGLCQSLVFATLNFSARGTCLAIGAAAVVALAGHAAADIKAVEPYFVAISKDNIPLKCSDGNIYYAVRMMKTGEVLRVDGSGGGWLRVEYPAGTRAYVKADEGMFDEGAKTLKLSRPSKLMSANTTGARPWWYLLETDVPAGTVFSNAEVVKAGDGAVEGYLIPAPTGSRAFIREEATRAATAEEAKGYKAAGSMEVAAKPAMSMPEAPKPTTHATTTVPTAPVPTATAPEATKPVATVLTTPTPSAAAPATPSPMITMTPTPAPPAGTTPTTPPTTTPAPATTTATAAAPMAPPAPPVVTKRVDDTETLRVMFDRVMQGDGNSAELSSVISEFNRAIDALGNSDTDVSKRNALRARLQALRLRQDVLDTQQHLTQTDAQFTEKMQRTTVAIQEVEKQAIYTIVGRILPSTVYDGRRGLPLMYRVESADSSSTRTIGYVVPRDGVELLAKMGKVVGISGEAKMDPALGLNIVAPRRVDVLEIVAGKLQVVTDSQATTTTTTTTTAAGTTTSSNGTLTTTTTVVPAPVTQPTPAPEPVPVAQPNEPKNDDMNK